MAQTDIGKIGFTVHDDWTPTAYEKLSLVRHNGATWVSKAGALASDEPSPSSAVWKIVAADGTSGENISFLPSGNISATNVSSAIRELDAEKAPTTHTHTAANIISSLGYTPVQQGTGIGQVAYNIVKMGWSSAYGLKVTVDATDLGPIKFKHDNAVTVKDQNFDTIAPGTYHVAGFMQGSTPHPYNGILEVFSIEEGQTYTVQRYTTWLGHIFVRTKSNSVWQPWQEVAHSGRLKTVGGQSIFGSGDIPVHTGKVIFMGSQALHVPSEGDGVYYILRDGGFSHICTVRNDAIVLNYTNAAVGITHKPGSFDCVNGQYNITKVVRIG